MHDGSSTPDIAPSPDGEIQVSAVEPSPVGLPDCAEEEIRLPGSVQPHGFLLMLDKAEARILAASRNAEDFLHVPIKLILGAPVDTVFDREILGAIRSLALSPRDEGVLLYLGAFRLKGELCSVVSHTTGSHRILEFEKLDRLVVPEIMNAVITNFIGRLSTLSSPLELCQAITQQIKQLTGFNRVLLYNFDEAGHGTVLAEENDGTLPSYLNLRFPASDIPMQARQLYVANIIRIIPAASYEPSPLLGIAGLNATSINLSQSVLRSVSPVHLEYMRNMGTLSSMSISILCEGKLWGLISGHHAVPYTVPYLVRSACDMLTKMVGTQLAAFRSAARLQELFHFHAVQRRVLTRMAADTSYVNALRHSLEDLQQVAGAHGAAIVLEDGIACSGQTPDEEQIARLVEWLNLQPTMEIFESRSLSLDLPWAAEMKDTASGLIAIRTSDLRRNYVLWFRPEVIRSVTWAGEPVKTVDTDQQLHPRHSFERWKETVQGQSVPWTEVELESAWDFRAALLTISLKRAEEAAELSEARFQQLTHAFPTLIWTATDSGRLTYVNDRWREMGMAAEGCWYEVAHLHADDRARVEISWKASQGTGALFEEEVRMRTGDAGTERWYLVRAVPLQTAGRQRAGWVGTSTETTDRREREATLRMTEKLATTGRMTSVIAHEINNPLESITNLMYLLRGEVGEQEPARGYISMAESELERISGITKQTLRWGRERSERKEIVDVSALFDDVLRLFSGKIRNRQVHLDRHDQKGVRIYAVGGQIRQVIANLISNAVDAVPVGGRIWTDAVETPEYITLTIGDAGSGMSDEQQRSLFQPFVSTKGDLGNGLGLYISQEIVDRHGGRLDVVSVLGKGTQMRVLLPNLSDGTGY